MSNKNNKQKETKGGLEVLAPDVEHLRQQVIRAEYRARLWKADYETAYYSLELDKLAPAYQELITKQRKEQEEFRDRQIAMIEEMKKNTSSGLTIEEVDENGNVIVSEEEVVDTTHPIGEENEA